MELVVEKKTAVYGRPTTVRTFNTDVLIDTALDVYQHHALLWNLKTILFPRCAAHHALRLLFLRSNSSDDSDAKPFWPDASREGSKMETRSLVLVNFGMDLPSEAVPLSWAQENRLRMPDVRSLFAVGLQKPELHMLLGIEHLVVVSLTKWRDRTGYSAQPYVSFPLKTWMGENGRCPYPGYGRQCWFVFEC